MTEIFRNGGQSKPSAKGAASPQGQGCPRCSCYVYHADQVNIFSHISCWSGIFHISCWPGKYISHVSCWSGKYISHISWWPGKCIFPHADQVNILNIFPLRYTYMYIYMSYSWDNIGVSLFTNWETGMLSNIHLQLVQRLSVSSFSFFLLSPPLLVAPNYVAPNYVAGSWYMVGCFGDSLSIWIRSKQTQYKSSPNRESEYQTARPK